MSAKKKTPKTTRGERATMVIDRWATMETELDRLRKLVFSTESDLMHVEKQMTEVQERLIAEKHELRKQLAAEKTSVEFWTYEATRWRTEAEDLRRAEAVSRVERGVS